jgi:hypothetical protein
MSSRTLTHEELERWDERRRDYRWLAAWARIEGDIERAERLDSMADRCAGVIARSEVVTA